MPAQEQRGNTIPGLDSAKRALAFMAVLAAGSMDIPDAYAGTPAPESSTAAGARAYESKTMDDVNREKAQALRDRQVMVNQAFKGVQIDLSLPSNSSDAFFEAYTIKVNGVKVGDITHVGLFAKRVDFYKFSDVEFLQAVKDKLQAAEITYTENTAVQQGAEQKAQDAAIERAKQQLVIEIAPEAQQLIEKWGGKIIGWKIINGEAHYQFALNILGMANPWDINALDAKSIKITKLSENIVFVQYTDEDGNSTVIHVIDGVEQ